MRVRCSCLECAVCAVTTKPTVPVSCLPYGEGSIYEPLAKQPLCSVAYSTMNTEHKLSEIRQIAITVSDVGTALPFYRDVLGLTFLFSPSANLAFLSAGSVRIMLSTPQGAGTVGH